MGNFAENLNLGKRVLPPCLLPDNFCWPTWKREVRKNGNIKQGKVENWMRNGRGVKVTKRGKEHFFFFFFFSFSFFFSCLSTFQNHWILFWVYREKTFHAGKKIRKNDFAPSEKYSSYASGLKPGLRGGRAVFWSGTFISKYCGNLF